MTTPFRLICTALLLSSCDADHPQSADTDSDNPSSSDTPNDSGDEQACDTAITAVIRDFSKDHPDFENEDFCCGISYGIVEDTLGEDGKPVLGNNYLGLADTPMVTSKESFSQWYNTDADINYEFEREIQLSEVAPGSFEYNNSAFFPLGETEGFGAEGNDKNYYFTTEIHISFVYKSGQVFSFTGDDDLFVFIEKNLVLDLGGVHAAEYGTIDLDTVAADQGLSVGETYSMDIFHAERHMDDSNFHIETTIECFKPAALVK